MQINRIYGKARQEDHEQKLWEYKNRSGTIKETGTEA